MSHTELSEVELQNLLDAITQRVVCDQEAVEGILRHYEANHEKLAPYARLIAHLHEVLVPQQPTSTFTHDLKRELIGQQQRSLFNWGGFPIRAQIAAVAAIVAGFILLLRRRSGAEIEMPDSLDIPALQQ